jgi:hypothetical protein
MDKKLELPNCVGLRFIEKSGIDCDHIVTINFNVSWSWLQAEASDRVPFLLRFSLFTPLFELMQDAKFGIK